MPVRPNSASLPYRGRGSSPRASYSAAAGTASAAQNSRTICTSARCSSSSSRRSAGMGAGYLRVFPPALTSMELDKTMRIENDKGEPLAEATLSVDENELIDLL